jgi:hypothetical protein
MNKLPNEVILDISNYLTISDKLNFASTSKKLHRIIFDSTSYSKLVFKNMDNFNRAMDLCGREEIGKHVRHLVIGNLNYDAQVLVTLPSVFSRVKNLE